MQLPSWLAFLTTAHFWVVLAFSLILLPLAWAAVRKWRSSRRQMNFGTAHRFRNARAAAGAAAGTAPPPPPPPPQPVAATVKVTPARSIALISGAMGWPGACLIFALVLLAVYLTNQKWDWLGAYHFVEPGSHSTRIVETTTEPVFSIRTSEKKSGCTRSELLLTVTKGEVSQISKPDHCEVSIDTALLETVEVSCDTPADHCKEAKTMGFTLKPDASADSQDVLLSFTTK